MYFLNVKEGYVMTPVKQNYRTIATKDLSLLLKYVDSPV